MSPHTKIFFDMLLINIICAVGATLPVDQDHLSTYRVTINIENNLIHITWAYHNLKKGTM